MALSSLFYGMEAYLAGDVEINNNVGQLIQMMQ